MSRIETVNVEELLSAGSGAGESWAANWYCDDNFPNTRFKRQTQSGFDFLFEIWPGGNFRRAVDVLHFPIGMRVDFVVIHGTITIRDKVFERGTWGRFAHCNREPLAAHFPQDNPTDSVIVLIRF